ncbi:MAG: hypothetical protein GX951_04500 [Mollicutes bacterium]|nr:hypothetical protein [Mollicutes bacterium]
MAKEVIITAGKVRRRQKFGKVLKLAVLLLLVLLIVVYIVLRITFNVGSFVVTLGSNKDLESGLAMFESLNDMTGKRWLKAENLQFMDNISIKWLPEDINKEAEGSHNGDNYIAYTFYIQNQGDIVINYWYNMFIDDVVKNVDEAIRIMIFLNEDVTVYAKGNSIDGEPEPDTKKFLSEKDGTIILEQRPNLQPGEYDRITVVVWIEGDDPECVDALIGGELKMHMDITEEHPAAYKNGE